MAKRSMLERAKKVQKNIDHYKTKRTELKRLIKKTTDFDVMMEAQAKLAKQPRNASPARLVTRCQQCGRPHAVYRKFGLCRICLRQELMIGNVPGGRKSSW